MSKISTWVLVGLLGAAAIWQSPRLTEETDTVTVTKTFVKDGKYLVYTDKNTFKIADTSVYFNFYSSDKWGEFKVGATYEIDHIGFRIGWLSWYENIVSFKEVK